MPRNALEIAKKEQIGMIYFNGNGVGHWQVSIVPHYYHSNRLWFMIVFTSVNNKNSFFLRKFTDNQYFNKGVIIIINKQKIYLKVNYVL